MLFGSPKATEFAANGDEVWNYSYWLSTYDPAHVPQAGHRDNRSSALSVTFDKQGIVKAYSTSSEELTPKMRPY